MSTTHIELGGGRYVVGAGTVGGMPTLFLEPVTESGPVGGAVPEGVGFSGEAASPDCLPHGTVLLSFGNRAAFDVVQKHMARVEDGLL